MGSRQNSCGGTLEPPQDEPPLQNPFQNPQTDTGVSLLPTATLSTGYYVEAAGALSGPLSDSDLRHHAESGASTALWWTDGLSSYGPYTGGQVVASLQLGQSCEGQEQSSYSEAVRAALQPDEQHLAELAQQAGTSLSEVVQFCYSSARAPRETAPEETAEQTEEQTEEASPETRQPCRGWRKLSKFKKERKAKQRKAWLYS